MLFQILGLRFLVELGLAREVVRLGAPLSSAAHPLPPSRLAGCLRMFSVADELPATAPVPQKEKALSLLSLRLSPPWFPFISGRCDFHLAVCLPGNTLRRL